jgi:predicted thioesterase
LVAGNRTAYCTAVSIKPGLTAHVEMVVTEADTAIALHSGDVPVLATPRVVAWCEQASCLVLEGLLGPNETSVGMRLQIDHVQPSAVGTAVRADATLEKVEGRRLTFVVNARDSRGLIAAGRVTRVIVDRDRFMEKAGS